MKNTNQQTNQLLAVLYDRPLSAKNLRQLLGGISPATLSRLTKLVGKEIMTFGLARASTYARPRDLRGGRHKFPVYRIDETGNAHFAVELWSLYGGYWWAGEAGWASRYYSSLPWFIYDMKPDGFVGRAFAQRFGPELGLPDRLTNWKDDDILIALSSRGEDTVGDLIIGEESLERYMVSSRQGPLVCSPADYPRLAEKAMAGDPVGSSAAGEQPKFTVSVEQEGACKKVLVKFSPLVSTPSGQRWSDLLVCEHIALGITRDMGICSAVSTIHKIGERTFLEVDRFDRIGILGRSPINSLTVVDAEFSGSGNNWSAASNALLSARMLSTEDAGNLSRLDLFGSLIANTDRHFGNISLIPLNLERTRFKLAPVYDMLPMYYRPKEGEELSCGVFQPHSAGDLGAAYEYAMKFWLEAGNDRRISEAFRNICSKNHEVLQEMGSGPRIIGPTRNFPD